MEILQNLIDIFLHVDKYLGDIVRQFGPWTYAILFLIIFMETGLVVTPFLPGDSLLFAAGAVAALVPDTINIWVMTLLLIVAAILGDTVNYWIGHWVGPKAFSGKVRFLKKEYLDRTNAFYEKHGGKTIILARFVPIIRTFAPFVAGIGAMNYSRFIVYNVAGGVAWVVIFTMLGYYFGNVPFVQHNFEIVILAIIGISLLPPIWEVVASRMEQRRQANAAVAPADPAD